MVTFLWISDEKWKLFYEEVMGNEIFLWRSDEKSRNEQVTKNEVAVSRNDEKKSKIRVVYYFVIAE